MYKIILFLQLPLLLFATSNTYERGKDLYFQKGCGNCHGTNAEGSSYYPKLANRSEKYIVKKLVDFKNGIANSQKQEIMFTFAKSLKKEDIQNIAAYLSNHKKESPKRYEIDDDLLGSMD